MRLLLVEDNPDVADSIVAFLERKGFVVDTAPSLSVAEAAIEDQAFDLVLLDRMLSDGDGLSLIAFSKTKRRPQRFVLLTALGDVSERVTGLESGAHDYISKPFEPRELLARIRNALRHPLQIASETRTFGPLVHDVHAGSFAIDGEPLSLRRTEALVLAALMARPGALVRRETIELSVYGYDKFVNANALESQISRLRKLLAQRTGQIKVQSIRGVGYRLSEDGAAG